MQAVYIEQYGNAQQLKLGHVEKPAVAAHQVLIKVEGAGVNPVDWMVRDGLLKDSGMHELPLILGWDAAGEVAQVGSDVDFVTDYVRHVLGFIGIKDVTFINGSGVGSGKEEIIKEAQLSIASIR